MWMVLLSTAALAETDDLEVKRRVNPKSPGFQADDNGQIHCYARVLVDTKGKPSEIDVKGCNERFAAAARQGVTKWRWVPPSAPTRTVVSTSFSDGPGIEKPSPCTHTVTVAGDGTVTSGEGTCALWLPAKLAAPESRQICRIGIARGQEPTIEGCTDDALGLAQAWVEASDWGTSGTVSLELMGPDLEPEIEPVNLTQPVIESSDLP